MRALMLSAVLVIAQSLASAVFAEQRCDPWVAKAVSVEGRVEVLPAGADRWRPVRRDERYCHADRFRVLADSRAAIELANDTILRLDQKTTLVLPAFAPGEGFWVDLVNGALHLISRVKRSLEIRTPFVNAGLEGTEFVVRVLADETRISVIEGQVAFENPHGRLSLAAGQAASAARGRAPVLRLDLKPEDSIHWALHYPAILAPASDRLVRAQQALAVGRAAQAEALIDAALAADEADPEALSLRSVVLLVRNDKAGALQAARNALDRAPQSASANLALSYALQAGFDLPAANAAVETALEAQPDNALAWARLAELSAALGDVERSDQAAERAVQLAPDLARTQAVRGFAHLIRFELDAALAAFERAVSLDSGEPLARLGMGLAKIRRGALAEGRRDLEIAASLDPGNSLIRSYLGKAYFAEHRNRVAGNEFELAKQFDPLDPTPWLYQAILEQSENRPVAALAAMEQSAERNDRRAVSRSRFALDQDLAVRNAATARIYRSLGFHQLALQRGRQAVAADQSNHSAHRFLADAYSSLPRHEIARVSELYQSQMLQPLNVNLIQPQLAVSDLGIIRGTGPSALSFSEFTPMFLSEGTYFQSNLLFGGFNTEGVDVLLSGLHGRAAYSIGHFAYKTDGFNTNNDQEQSLSSAFVQGKVTDRTSVQAELRIRDRNSGEPIWFFDSNIRPLVRSDIQTRSVRLGARHAFQPNSVLLAALRLEEADRLEIPGAFSYSDQDIESVTGEARYLFDSENWGFTVGLSHVSLEDRRDALLCLFSTPFACLFPVETKSRADKDHTNAYLYGRFEPLRDLELTAGISGDSFGGAADGTDRVNGKLGFVWQLNDTTRVRSAAIQSVSKLESSEVVIGDRTLEPTHVSGFNQFYNDLPGSRSQRLGVGLDHQFTSRLFGGLEWSERRIEVLIDQTLAERDEYLGRAYLYYAPTDRIALSLDYSYQEFDRSQQTGTGPGGFGAAGTEAIVELTTHRVPIELTYSHSSRLSGRLRATHVQQSGEFIDLSAGPFGDPTRGGSDRFWVFDASLDYRLPRRAGMVSVGMENLFDEEFNFQDTDLSNPTIIPRQFFYARLNLSF